MGMLLSERFPERGRRYATLIYVVPKVGEGVGGGAYIYVPPQRVWFWGHSTTGAGACEREKKNRLIAG